MRQTSIYRYHQINCVESFLYARFAFLSGSQYVSLKPVRFCYSEERLYEHDMDIQNQAYLALI